MRGLVMVSLMVSLIVVGMARSSAAQSRSAFVGAAPQVDYDAPGVGGPGWVPGFSLEAGVHLSPKLNLRADLDRAGTPINETTTGVTSSRTTSLSILLGAHAISYGRTRCDVVLGATVMNVRNKDTNPSFYHVREHQSYVAPTFGIDLPVAVSRHLSIVPEFRMNVTLVNNLFSNADGLSELPRIRVAARWNF